MATGAGTGGDAEADTLNDIENIDGSDFGDTIIGDEYRNVLRGFAGDDFINAGGGEDTLVGGSGNDSLTGGAGGDTYTYTTGDGLDLIYELNSDIGWDTLRFLGSTLKQLIFERTVDDLNDLVIRSGNGTALIRIEDQFLGSNSEIEMFSFADGGNLSRTQVSKELWITGTSSGETIFNLPDFARVRAGGGNDTVFGSDFGDQIDGGKGNDLLRGDSGSDTYIYRSGDGNDTITDYVDGTFDNFTISNQLTLVDLKQTDVFIYKNFANSAVLNIRDNLTGQVISVSNQFSNGGIYNHGISSIDFSDGSTLNRTQISDLSAIVGTSGAEIIAGGAIADRIYGLVAMTSLGEEPGTTLTTTSLVAATT